MPTGSSHYRWPAHASPMTESHGYPHRAPSGTNRASLPITLIALPIRLPAPLLCRVCDVSEGMLRRWEVALLGKFGVGLNISRSASVHNSNATHDNLPLSTLHRHQTLLYFSEFMYQSTARESTDGRYLSLQLGALVPKCSPHKVSSVRSCSTHSTSQMMHGWTA